MDGAGTRRNCRMAAWNQLLLPVLMLLYSLGASADGNVTMESLTIYNTHEWIMKPTVYFRCQHESKVYLPDVVEKNQDYAFMGQESWQPLTTLHGEKCKRCGLYEEDTIKSDDIFYEGELCPKDFTASPEGRFVLFKEKEINATLLCLDCGVIPGSGVAAGPDVSEDDEKDDQGAGLAFLIIVLVFVVLFALGVVAYTKWRQKQRRDQQARFVKMFEDDDELDAELGLKEDDL
ncbi:unnamed protein product [Calypogeia fissa]